jgi:hypothetical protein
VRDSQEGWAAEIAKSSGLGDNCYCGGYDLSGDIGSAQKISGGPAPLDVTGINKLGFERIGGLRTGDIQFTSFFNPSPGQEHAALSGLPITDTQIMYTHGTALGNPAACMICKQLDYNPTRAANGMLTVSVSAQSNGYGLEWGRLLTAGLRTDTAATNGTSIDGGGSTAFGAQAYLQVTALTGTDVTVKIQDSADNVTFADVTSFAFAQTTAAHTFQRIATTNAATIRRYLRVATTTSGGFTSATFAVVVVRNPIAGQAF